MTNKIDSCVNAYENSSCIQGFNMEIFNLKKLKKVKVKKSQAEISRKVHSLW
jgi:hypothetical protein